MDIWVIVAIIGGSLAVLGIVMFIVGNLVRSGPPRALGAEEIGKLLGKIWDFLRKLFGISLNDPDPAKRMRAMGIAVFIVGSLVVAGSVYGGSRNNSDEPDASTTSTTTSTTDTSTPPAGS